MLNYNSIYQGDCLELIKDVDDNSVPLVIADPPYFKVVNEKWDYEWRTEEEYIKWSLTWMSEIHRVLRRCFELLFQFYI